MDIFTQNELVNIPNKARAIALGNFDGIHQGHQKILSILKEKANELKVDSSVFTFEPHPLALFKPDLKNYRLTVKDEKLSIIKKLGINEVIAIAFDQQFANITAESFIKEHLVDRLNIKYLITGENFHFGHARQGSPDMLREYSKQFGFIYEELPAIRNEHFVRFSSSKVREYLFEGKLTEANEILGYDYFISGEVIKGNQNGRKINFPTVNMQFNNDKLIPKFGVYRSSTIIDGKKYASITNIGVKPTVGSAEPLCETHLLNYDSDLYGKTIKVSLTKFIRPEMKFNSLEELKNQISKDIENSYAE